MTHLNPAFSDDDVSSSVGESLDCVGWVKLVPPGSQSCGGSCVREGTRKSWVNHEALCKERRHCGNIFHMASRNSFGYVV